MLSPTGCEKPFRVFGYVVSFHLNEVGHILNVDTTPLERCLTLHGKGSGKIFDKNGNYLGDIYPGRYNKREQVLGEISIKTEEERIVICFDPLYNLRKNLDIKFFELKKNKSVELLKGTKLLLGCGQLKIKDQVYSDVKKIKVVSEKVDVFAIEDCYGFLFP